MICSGRDDSVGDMVGVEMTGRDDCKKISTTAGARLRGRGCTWRWLGGERA